MTRPEELRALVEALEECRGVLAMLTDPNSALSGLSIQSAYAQVVAAEAKARTTLTRAESLLSSVPDGGWKLVPVEPTPEMLGAFWRQKNTGTQELRRGADKDFSDYAAYRAMLSASPQGRSENG